MVQGYPVEILPKREYEVRLDIPLMLKAYPNLYVSRRIDGTREDLVQLVDGDYVLLDEALEKVGVANFSVNLLGALFEPARHILYSPIKDELKQAWEGEELQFEITEDTYEIKQPSFAVYYKIDDFLKFPMKQEMTFTKDSEYTTFRTKAIANGANKKYLEPFKKGSTITFPVNQRANHIPTCCNYWHMTFDTYSFDNPHIPINNSDSHNTIRRILRHMRHDFLTLRGIIEIPKYDTISPCFYHQGKYNAIKRHILPCIKKMQRIL